MCFNIRDIYLSDEPKRDAVENAKNFHTDVIVVALENTSHGLRNTKYVASFFTYDNILELKSSHAKTGDYLNGTFFYTRNMVLIDTCSHENIRAVIEHLLEEGEFRDVFRKL